MPITDAQVEAFARRFYPDHAHRLHRVVFEELRAAIEAAERAAWSTDMDAPEDGETVLTHHRDDLFPVTAFRIEGTWLRQTEGPEDEYGPGKWGPLFQPPTHWRPLPVPPEAGDD